MFPTHVFIFTCEKCAKRLLWSQEEEEEKTHSRGSTSAGERSIVQTILTGQDRIPQEREVHVAHPSPSLPFALPRQMVPTYASPSSSSPPRAFVIVC
ncbi:hypothetical protein CEXT_506071 [Caerostris extrusa]|uniref:Uncharacterized protein n=1 Tax=Caerostris extrusa TaxID=172846 RepID=A0AAV4XDB4_CAEEX|nr:hypothetical protein CEXT_506071 [Caerostris extrusa]